MLLVLKRLWRALLDMCGDYVYFKNRLKRVSDILANLGVASLAVGLFDEKKILGFWIGLGFMFVSILLTMEDKK